MYLKLVFVSPIRGLMVQCLTILDSTVLELKVVDLTVLGITVVGLAQVILVIVVNYQRVGIEMQDLVLFYFTSLKVSERFFSTRYGLPK